MAPETTKSIKTLKTMCNRDCPDACGMLATVEDGRVVKLGGDPEHPITGGFLCYRTNRFLKRQYADDRILEPMIRRNGSFEPIGWDAVLDLLAEKLRDAREQHGAESIFHYRSGGSLGLMKQVTDTFFERFGPVAMKSGDICSGAGEAAQEADFADVQAHDWFDLRHSRTVVMWGKNPFVSSIHLVPLLREIREAGCRIVQIDPVHHRGASVCDLVLQPKPGADIPLALGIARHLFDRDAIDPDAANYCDHLDAFREQALAQDVDGWAAQADVSADALRQLGDWYAEKPAAILVGWGIQRRRYGSASVRMMDALAAISGNLGIQGGGVSFSVNRRGAFDTSFQKGLSAAPRSIPEPLLGPGWLNADPAYRLLWITAGNPVAMLPESETVAEAIQAIETTVVVDSHWTDTAQLADIVLPTTTMLEDDDLVGSYGHHYMGKLQPVVAPLGEARTDYAIVQGLQQRLGVDEAFARPAEAWQRELLRKSENAGVDFERLETGVARNPHAPEVPYADRKFATASGKVSLIHQIPLDGEEVDPQRPLKLMAIATEKSQASQWMVDAQQGPARCTVHPDAANGFAAGDVVRLESAIRTIEVTLQFDEQQRRDVAVMEKGGWHRQGRSANALVPARITDDGEGACYYDTPVRLLPLEG